MSTSVVTRKGQVTIPVELRRKLKLEEGSLVAFSEENGEIVLRPVETSVKASFGIVRAKRTASLEEMDKADSAQRQSLIAVDTNVLVRVLVDDPDEVAQVRRARQFAEAAEELYVPQIVQVESVWVLKGAYDLTRVEITDVLEHLATNRAYQLQRAPRFHEALALYRAGAADFADCLILAEARSSELELATFDRRLRRADGTRTP